MKVKWHIEEIKNNKILIIDDFNGDSMTITNGVEEVLEDLFKQGKLDNKTQLFYQDTEGQIDEIIFTIVNNEIIFNRFQFGGW